MNTSPLKSIIFLIGVFILQLPPIAIAHSVNYVSYLSVEVYNNNFLLKGENEDDRLNFTTDNFVARLNNGKYACDPREIAEVYPSRSQSKQASKCNSGISKYTAPTNKQFKTRWNPETHEFDPDYLLGVGSRTRVIKLNLKLEGKPTFERRKHFLCDWTIKGPFGTISYKRRDCKFFEIKIQTEADYQANVVVKKRGKIVHRTQDLPFRIRDFLIVALGDSFGSGEGNPHTYFPHDYIKAKTDKPPMWLDPRCHRSLFSSSIQSTTILARDYWNHSFSVANFACSGAESGPGLRFKYTGRSSASQIAKLWTRGNTSRKPTTRYESFKGFSVNGSDRISTVAGQNSKTDPAPFDLDSQITQLSKALSCEAGSCRRQPDAILLYIGVNDIGFGKRLIEVLVKNCANRKKCRSMAIDEITNGLKSTEENLKKFAQELKNIGISPPGGDASIFLVTYPNPLTKRARKLTAQERRTGKYKGRFNLCGEGKTAFDHQDNRAFLGGFARILGLGIDKLGAKFARDEIIVKLNEMLHKFDRNADPNGEGWTLVLNDQSMLGRGFCADNSMFNVFLESNDKQGPVYPNYFSEKIDCQDSNNSNCKIFKSIAIPSGPMHPNYFGHRDVASRIIPKLKLLFGLDQKPR